MSEPRFSIVIPTRNRASLLRSALGTALAQRYPDLEIVVSDDSTDDETRRVVDELEDGRLRYVRPSRHMVQADHWEFAVEQTRGQWVILYGDDDGAPPSFLDRLTGAIESHDPRLISWGSAYYVHPGTVGTRANALTVQPFTGSARRIPGAEELERLFARREGPSFPKFGPNAAVRRDLLDAVRSHAGRVFQPPVPDYTFGPVALALEPDYLFIDQPLALCGIAATSIGLVLSRTEGSGHARRLIGSDDALRWVPLRAKAVDNLCAESLLRAKAATPHLLGSLRLDVVRYFVTCHAQLDQAARDGSPEGLAEWRNALARQPERIRGAVHNELASGRRRERLGRAARDRLQHIGALRAARRFVRRTVERRSDYLYVLGEEAGFSDLAGCARWVEQNVLPSIAPALSRAPATIGGRIREIP